VQESTRNNCSFAGKQTDSRTNGREQEADCRTDCKGKKMTYQQAMQLLDRVRDGQHYPEHVITMALKMTGDLPDDQ
jgi:hypothetical protein